MAATETLPRFFKVFISHFSSDSMMIPISYYDQLPHLLPETVILQGTGGCFWNVAMTIKLDEVYFGQGWSKFVKDNSLTDGDFLTFVYNGDRVFEVSIYGSDGCKETRAVMENCKEVSIYSLSSEDTDSNSESDKNIGKSKVEVMADSDNKEDNVYSLSSEETDTNTCSEIKIAINIPKLRNKGKKRDEIVESSDEDSDNTEAFTQLDFQENSNSDSSYTPDYKNTSTYVKNKGKSKVKEHDSSCSIITAKKRNKKVKSKIKNPEAYLDNPKNLHFETGLKNRKFELLVHAQIVQDYCLKFEDYINYIDKHGKLEAKTAKWKDHRVCIKKWMHICDRNNLKEDDRILCELLRKQDVVYAIKVHIVRGKYL